MHSATFPAKSSRSLTITPFPHDAEQGFSTHGAYEQQLFVLQGELCNE